MYTPRTNAWVATVKSERRNIIMQCYEYQAMLAYVQNALKPMKLPLIMDEALAADIIDKLHVMDISTLVSLDTGLVRATALGNFVETRQAA